MPELPEVETVRRTLLDKLTGRTVADVEILAPKFIRNMSSEEFRHRATGARIEGLRRRGKYLIIDLSTGDELVIHLKMAGRLLYLPSGEPLAKHTHVIFRLDNGDHLRYVDLRHFGGLHLLGPGREGAPQGLETLGPEPLTPSFTPDYLRESLGRRKTRIKPLLLDQTFIAGLGNIYADECLYDAGIHPERIASSLTGEEVQRLYEAIGHILQWSIENGGTTFSTYVDGEGRKGRFAANLRVYRREDQACPRCGAPVRRLKLGSRSAHYCEVCQK